MSKPSSIWAICAFVAFSSAGVAVAASPAGEATPAAKKKKGKLSRTKGHKKGLKGHKKGHKKGKKKLGRDEPRPPKEDPAPDNPPTALDDGMQRAITDLHNAARSAVGVPGLSWSDEIAGYAQAWADNLGEQGCPMTHRPQPRPYGENLYMWQSGSGAPSAAEIVGAWTAEAANYDASDGSCSGICGHYTQVVWSTTQRVGCGRAICGDKHLYVCSYDPQGNFFGQKPFE